MFKHILLPTDGSELSRTALKAAVAFAKESGARVTGLHVIPEFHTLTYQPEMVQDTRAQYAIDSAAHSRKLLAEVESHARELGVACATVSLTAEHPYEAIIQAATDNGCDLIAMASHGRRGVKGLLLGSETQKVLTHSQIPVLVYR